VAPSGEPPPEPLRLGLLSGLTGCGDGAGEATVCVGWGAAVGCVWVVAGGSVTARAGAGVDRTGFGRASRRCFLFGLFTAGLFALGVATTLVLAAVVAGVAGLSVAGGPDERAPNQAVSRAATAIPQIAAIEPIVTTSRRITSSGTRPARSSRG
jgi:hypothetical protein